MNRPLPRGDRGHRISDPRRAPGSGRAVPGARRLVGGTAAAASSMAVGHHEPPVGSRALGRVQAGRKAACRGSRKARHGVLRGGAECRSALMPWLIR